METLSMEIGKKYMHLEIPGLTCTILDFTNKEIKVKHFTPGPYKWNGIRDGIGFYDKKIFEKIWLSQKN